MIYHHIFQMPSILLSWQQQNLHLFWKPLCLVLFLEEETCVHFFYSTRDFRSSVTAQDFSGNSVKLVVIKKKTRVQLGDAFVFWNSYSLQHNKNIWNHAHITQIHFDRQANESWVFIFFTFVYLLKSSLTALRQYNSASWWLKAALFIWSQGTETAQ